MRNDIVEMDIFVSPLEVVDYSLVRKLLLNNEQILEKVHDSLVDVEMVKLGDHSLLIFKIFVKRVNQSVAFVNNAADIVEYLGVGIFFEFGKGIVECVVFAFFTLQLIVHALDLSVVALKLADNHFLVDALLKPVFDLFKMLHNLRQLFRVCFLGFRFFKQECRLFSELINFLFKGSKHRFEVSLLELVNVDHVVVAMLADSTTETDTTGTVLAKAFDRLKTVLDAAARG